MDNPTLEKLNLGRLPFWQPLFSVHSSAVPEAYWRSLHYFNVYRLVVAGVFVIAPVIFGVSFPFGTFDPSLFFLVSIIYVMFSVMAILGISSRWPPFNLQVSIHLIADVVFIILLMHASGGVKNGIGTLLVVSLAGAGLISPGSLAMFYAAIASIGVLLEQSYLVVVQESSTSDFVHAGLLSISFFATAGLSHFLGRRLVASELLARQQSIDLENMEQVNQLVIQDMQDAVLVVDDQGRIKHRNAQTERLLGNPGHFREDLTVEDYSTALDARYKSWLDNPGAVFAPMRVQATGKQVRIRIIPIGGDRRLGAVIFLEDISRLQVQAQQMKLAALGRLTANIAHEIRNPLSAIAHATQLLQEEEAADATHQRLLQIILDNSHRLDKMVQDVLQLNRRDRATPEVISLQSFLKSFIEQFSQIERISLSTFSIENDANLSIYFDRTHLGQVLWNLCRNAWRHCKRNQGSIRLCVSAAHMENMIQVDVIDDGEGVDDEYQSQLFEPFFTTDSQGTGLGLYIAREICEANGATLDYIEVAPGGQFRLCCKAVSIHPPINPTK